MLDLLFEHFFAKRFDQRETIVILDSGVNLEKIDTRYLCRKGAVNLSAQSEHDSVGHGTKLFRLGQSIIDFKRTCIQPIKTFVEEPERAALNYMYGLIYLQSYRFEKLVIALEDEGFYYDEPKYLSQILDFAQVYVAAGNGRIKLTNDKCNVYPACFRIKFSNRSFYVVSSSEFNFGEIVDLNYNHEFDGSSGSSFSVMRAACSK